MIHLEIDVKGENRGVEKPNSKDVINVVCIGNVIHFRSIETSEKQFLFKVCLM